MLSTEAEYKKLPLRPMVYTDVHPICQATLCTLLNTLPFDASEDPVESTWISDNGFMITPPAPRSLNLLFSSPTASPGLLSAKLRIAETEVVPDKDKCEEEQRPSGLLQNLELKKSGPGSKQHELLATADDILAFDRAKS